jgi:hypothetical protein
MKSIRKQTKPVAKRWISITWLLRTIRLRSSDKQLGKTPVDSKAKRGLASPFVASIVFDPRVVTSWSPSHRGTHEYTALI